MLHCVEPEEVEAPVVRAQRQRPPVNPEAPILTKKGYYTVPPVKRLKRMTNQQLRVPSLPPSPSPDPSPTDNANGLSDKVRTLSMDNTLRTSISKIELTAAQYPKTGAKRPLLSCTILSSLELQAMERFVVGREEVGEVQFLLPADLVGIDLDNVVEIEKGKIQVYGLEGQAAAPALGKGINVPAMLVFRFVWEEMRPFQNVAGCTPPGIADL